MDYGCLVETEFQRVRQTLADLHEDEDDFKNQWGLEAINAARAYANVELAKGLSTTAGDGVTVGFVDTGIDLDHPLFTGDVTEEFLLMAVDETGAGSSHGTSVASVVGADAEGLIPAERQHGFRGVAPGADLKMFAIPVGSGGGLYRPISLSGLASQEGDFKSIFDHALSRDVDILNLSIGFQGIIDNYSKQEVRANFEDAIAAMAQAGASEKTILVWAAGNAHGDPCTAGTDNCVGATTDPPVDGAINAVSVQVLPGLPARITRLRGHSVAVVAVGADTNADGYPDIASFSNRCGIAADWCIAAPGVNVRVAVFGEINGVEGSRGIGPVRGTSVAAPMVAGGLAVMKQLFRDQLANTALVERLYQTANKNGPFSDAAIYGQGLMDLGAATSPVGPTTMTMSQTVDGTGFDVQTTRITSGLALGDGLRQALAGREIVAFDQLGAPFWFGLSGFARPADGPTLSTHLADLLSGLRTAHRDRARQTTAQPSWSGAANGPARDDVRLRFGTPGSLAPVANGHLSLARGAITLALGPGDGLLSAQAFSTTASAGREPVTGLSLAFRPLGAPVGLRIGWLAERHTLLGTATAGGFGRVSADAVFAGVDGALDAGAWRLSADAEIGAVGPRIHGGFVTRMSPLGTSAFALRASRRTTADDSVTVGISQPLRVENGQASLSIPVGRTKQGDVMRSSLQADVKPSGRQLELSVRWGRSLAAGDLVADIAWIRDPGHDAHAEASWRVLAAWRARF